MTIFLLCQPFIVILENRPVFKRQFSGEVLIQGGALATADHLPFQPSALWLCSGEGTGQKKLQLIFRGQRFI